MKTSDKTENIIKALFEVSKEIKNTKASAVNDYYDSSYTPLPELLKYIDPILQKNDLILIQSGSMLCEKSLTVSTRLIHVPSLEWIETYLGLPAYIKEKHEPQTVGIAMTYGRRYSIDALFKIASESDSDGNGPDIPDKKPSQGKGKSYSGKLDFNVVREDISNMNIEEIDAYAVKINKEYNMSEKQKNAIRNIFSDRRSEINQDPNPFDDDEIPL